jgi:hypothetical protein
MGEHIGLGVYQNIVSQKEHFNPNLLRIWGFVYQHLNVIVWELGFCVPTFKCKGLIQSRVMAYGLE